MRTLEDLVARCKGEVGLTVNPHRNAYQSMAEYLSDREPDLDVRKDLADLLAAPDLYELQFYPDTPVGFYLVYGRSLAEVLDLAHRALITTPPASGRKGPPNE